MYFLYIRGEHNGHWYFSGMFPGSYFWTEASRLAQIVYGETNVTYRFHEN